jgi:Domain of unknown function (DUF4436)
MKLRIVGLVLFIGAYIASIVLYVYSGMGRTQHIVEGQPEADGTKVVIDVEDVQSNAGVLVVNLTVSPGPAMLDPVTHSLNENLSIVVTSAITPVRRDWSKGTLPGTVAVGLNITGDSTDWPFDDYISGSIEVELFRGTAQEPHLASVTFIDSLPGWLVDVPVAATRDSVAPYRVHLQRAPSTLAFAFVIIGVLIALAGLSLFVADQTARDLRRFQPAMAAWFAAMLFAVVPLRNALPDAPPFGAWIDITIVLWVIVVLVISMVVYISCWWRQLKPDEPTSS